MRRATPLVLAGLFTLAGAAPALAAHRPAAEADVTVTVPITAEAWWTSSPVCAGGVPCGTLGATPVNPFGAGTLHVAVTAGTETARSYLTLGTAAPPGAELTDATLTVALDTTTPGDGNEAPDTSHVWVCVTTQPVTPGEGQIGTPPAADCSTHVELNYQPGAIPSLTGDLTPMLAVLSKPKITLALIASQRSATTDAWHVVFSSHTRAAAPTPPASLVETFGPTGSTVAPSPPAPPAPSTRTPALPATSPAPPSVAPPAYVPPAVPLPGDVTATDAPAPAPQVAGSTAAASAAPSAPLADSASTTVGFAYPVVLLLPLVIGTTLYALGRQLVGPMRRRPER